MSSNRAGKTKAAGRPHPAASARKGGLRYVSDETPGIRRKKRGSQFVYQDPKGRRLDNPKALQRVRSLAIPPAWKEVWISPFENGHLQATGRDDRNRKQYLYHPRWREVRDETKFSRMIEFGKALPRMRRQIQAALRERGLSRRKVLASVVRLLEASHVRIGNEEYERQNRSYGLTTLKNQHARVNGIEVRLKFRGKSGKEHEISVEDPVLARIVCECQDLPGQDLFGYLGENGKAVDVRSDDVNEFVREIAGADFTAKDFRTWAGTVLMLEALQFEPNGKPLKKYVTEAVNRVASRLGNTAAVCRKCYVHPAVIEAFQRGRLPRLQSASIRKKTGLSPSEKALLRFLQEVKRHESNPQRLSRELSQSIRNARKQRRKS